MTSLDIAGAVDRATRGVLEHDGATVSVVRKPDPTSGYVVADGSHETTIDAWIGADAERNIRAAIESFISAHRAPLAQTGAYLGAWVDDGYLVLDVVNVIPERNVALNAARDRGERAIFDLATGDVLWTHNFFTFAGPYATALDDSHGKV